MVLFWSNGHIYITSIYILVPRWTCIVTFYHNMFAGTSPWHLFTPTSPWLLVGHWPQKLFPLDPFVEFVAGVIVNSKVSLGELSLTGEEEFLEIDTDLLCQFISSEYLRFILTIKLLWWKLKKYSRVDSEYQVFCATMNWVNHDISNRRRWVTFKKSSQRCQIVKLWLIHYSSG